jgi:hypothetical protein
MKSVLVDFDCVPRPWHRRASLYAGATRFSQEIMSLATAVEHSVGTDSIMNIQGLHVCWGHPRWTSDQGDGDEEEFQSSVEPDIYGSTLLCLWTSLACHLRTLRLEVYTDILPIITSLHGRLAPALSTVELRVYSGAWSDMEEGELEDALVQVARGLIIEAATTLETLCLYLESAATGDGDNLDLYGFFNALSRTTFPRIFNLSIQAAFKDGEDVHIADLIDTLVKQGTLSNLALNPCDSFGHCHETGVLAYLAMLQTRGHRWRYLEKLNLYHRSLSRRGDSLHTMTDPEQISMAPLLLANPKLQVLHLDGDYVGSEELSSILACLNPKHLYSLTILIKVVRPSTLDTLASSLPSLRILNLKLNQAQPDGPFLEDLMQAIQQEEALEATVSTYPNDQVMPPLTWLHHKQLTADRRRDRKPYGEHRRRLAQLRADANDRTFLAEMEGGRDRRRGHGHDDGHFRKWSLREASIIHDYFQGCVVRSPPGHALVVAKALLATVPGLMITKVDPVPWPNDVGV